MFFCRKANWTASKARAYLLLAFFFQATSVDGWNPSVAALGSPPVAASIEFTSDNPLSSDAGHGSLSWNEVANATAYVVRSSTDPELIYFSGSQTTAFVSGLPDGEYGFSVEALDADSNVLARSSESMVLEVKHLSLGLTWLLFSVGLVVVVAMLWVIIQGTVTSRGPTQLSSKTASANATRDPGGGRHGS